MKMSCIAVSDRAVERRLVILVLSAVVLLLAFGSASLSLAQAAQAPGWSRGQQDLGITYDECLRRASSALGAERYRIDYAAGNFAVGIKQVHTAVVICGPAPNDRMLVQIVVASNGEGGGAERECLQAQMERPGTPSTCGTTPPAGPPAAPNPPPSSPPGVPPPAAPPIPPPASNCSCSTSSPYCLSVRPGAGPDGRAGAYVYFSTPVPRYGGALGVPDWIGLFRAGTRTDYVSYQLNESYCPLFFYSVLPGNYEFRYIERTDYDNPRATIPVIVTADGQFASAATALALERTPSGPGCGLGVRWIEKEEGWSGVWTRRGTSNVFDLNATKSGQAPLTAVQTITITGNSVSIIRRNASDGNDCEMEGTIGPDGIGVTGTYRCRSGGPYSWTAQIQCR
jgi:hypothetical protein